MFVDDDTFRRWRKIMQFGPWMMPNFQEWMRQIDDEFKAFDEQFYRNLPRELLRETKYPDGSVRREVGPIVYGYSMTIGPDGKPTIREFGNVQHGESSPWRSLTGKREPLADVVDSEWELRVTLELPGVSKEDIDLRVDDDGYLRVSVEGQGRQYEKSLKLPESVRVGEARSTFTNGILEVVFPKEPERSSAVRIKIE